MQNFKDAFLNALNTRFKKKYFRSLQVLNFLSFTISINEIFKNLDTFRRKVLLKTEREKTPNNA